ncbi:hypothetical protein SYNTR_0941 [Candidatus Syntrophocurvum alkaliphilum]|uniref:Uncharacterized protein n=1 Tax=Candidatus Syntrophocurvum alkaliphilum TaxID=2293317 RepID=A0A6I6DG71_9FIRM|nr:hypothetical protein [Candidatus Syntrophocurvum alkaliphilum]QGT99534.1 hypothetical protein SYNTR_0941 [Candidatus Syntrophocurvum alkaliphilum]
MDNINHPYLSGGIFFTLLLQARKQRGNARGRLQGGNDSFSDTEVLKGLIYVTNRKKEISYLTTFKKNTSEYKSCQFSGGTYIPFNEKHVIDSFDDAIKNNYSDTLGRMSDFVDSYLDIENTSKVEWLIKALLEVVELDAAIKDSDLFYIQSTGQALSKKALTSLVNIDFQPFLLGVLHYIILNRQDNTLGRATYEAWHERSTKHSGWKFTSDIGSGINRHVNVAVLRTKEKSTSEFTSSQNFSVQTKMTNIQPDNHLQFDFCISFAEQNIKLDVTSEDGAQKVFSTNYTDCKADDFSIEVKNRIMRWYVGGGNQPFTVTITDKRIDLAKSQFADIEVKLFAGDELSLEEELRYNHLGLLIKRFEHERCVKEKAVTAYLKDKMFQTYSHVGFYTHLLEFIKEILDFPYRRGAFQDAEYREKFVQFDVYTTTVSKHCGGYFVVDLPRQDVEEAFKKDGLLQFQGNSVCDWGVEMAKKIAVQYYVRYIGRQIIDHEHIVLDSDEYWNTQKTSVHIWNIGPH